MVNELKDLLESKIMQYPVCVVPNKTEYLKFLTKKQATAVFREWLEKKRQHNQTRILNEFEKKMIDQEYADLLKEVVEA